MKTLKQLWNKYNPFDIGSTIDKMSVLFKHHEQNISSQVGDIKSSINKMEKKLIFDVVELKKELEFKTLLINNVVENVPDMIWAKDLNGVYMYANKAIREQLLFDDNPIGKTDMELARNAKNIYGDENHTFGFVCNDSDKDVKELVENGLWDSTDTDMGQYFEWGKVKGKDMYLDVKKCPMYINGKFVGIMGSGRIMTPYVELEKQNNCKGKCGVDSIFDKYKFTEGVRND